MEKIRIWDRWTVLCNWGIFISLLLSYITVEATGFGYALHVLFISTLFITLFGRTVWGFFGPASVQIKNMFYPIGNIFTQLYDLVNFRREDYYGHSPISGLFSVVFLALLWMVAVTGLFAVNNGSYGSFISEIFTISPADPISLFHKDIVGFTTFYGIVYAVGMIVSIMIDG